MVVIYRALKWKNMRAQRVHILCTGPSVGEVEVVGSDTAKHREDALQQINL